MLPLDLARDYEGANLLRWLAVAQPPAASGTTLITRTNRPLSRFAQQFIDAVGPTAKSRYT